MRITEINNPGELAGCRLLWKLLLAKTPGANYFQSIDWLEPYWRHFGHDQKLRILIVHSDDEAIGILPLVVRNDRSRLGSARVLSYPLDHWGVFYGPIGPQPAATLTAALQYIRSRVRDWDVLSLGWVHRDGCDRGRTQRALRFVGWPPVEELLALAPTVDLRSSWEEYWPTRDGHWRSNVMRCERRLAEQGPLEYVRYRPSGISYADADPRWDLYEACLHVAANTWQAEAATGNTVSHPTVEPFLREAHQAAVRAGGLDLNLLYVGGQPAAFAYNYFYRGRVFGLRMGYDPAVSRHGTGTVLLKRMIQDSFERRDEAFDLGPSSLDWKRPWQTSVEASYRYTYFAAGAPRAQARRVKHYVKKWLGRELSAAR